MTWSCKWGGCLDDGFYEKLEAEGQLSEKDRMPDVSGFGLYIEAYQELSTCRNNGMGMGPIPFTALVQYASIYELEGEDFSDFLFVIRAMDKAELEDYSRRSKDGDRVGKRSKNKSPSVRTR